VHLSGLPSRFSPGVSKAITGVRASVRSRGLLIAMLLLPPERLRDNSYGSVAPLHFHFPGVCQYSFPLHTSLPASNCIASHLSKPWGAGLKKTGLRCLGPFSATKNLAYLPCRLGTDGSTFHFNSGGGGLKKASGPRPSPWRFVLHCLISSFAVSFHPVVLGVYNMPYKNCGKAARLSSSCPGVIFPAPVASTRRAFGRPTTGVRPSSKSCASFRGQAGTLRRDSYSPRCSHKACVFPAQPGAHGECAYHRRQAAEPGCFQSLQPSSLLLDQARFGLPDTEPEDGRVQDRHRLASERVRFMLGESA